VRSGRVGTSTARSFAIKQDQAPGQGKPSSMQGRDCTGRCRPRAGGQLASQLAATATRCRREHVEEEPLPSQREIRHATALGHALVGKHFPRLGYELEVSSTVQKQHEVTQHPRPSGTRWLS